jgi:hypothetical protein
VIRKKSDDNPKLNHRIHEDMCQVFNSQFGGFSFRHNIIISFIDYSLGGFVEILHSVIIFPLRQSSSGNITTSGDISPNPRSGGSINSKSHGSINDKSHA